MADISALPIPSEEDISGLPVPPEADISGLPVPQEDELPAPNPEDLIPETLEFTLFTPWGDYNWDTGIDIEKDTAAALMGFSEGFMDLSRGVEQLATEGAEAVGIDVQATKDMQERQKALYKKYEKMNPDAYAKGELVGFIADPVALAVPMAKAKTYIQAAKTGLVMGAGFGGLSHVEEGESRLKNMLIGAGGGMILTPAIIALGKSANKLYTGSQDKFGAKIAKETVDVFEETYHRLLAASDDADLNKLQQQTSRMLGLTADDISKLSTNSGKQIMLKTTKESAADWLAAKGITTDQYTPANLFDRIAKPMNDRLKEVAPKIYRKMMKNEAEMLETAHAYYSRVDTHVKAISKLPKNLQAEYEKALFNGNDERIRAIIRKYPVPGLMDAYNDNRKMWKELAKMQKDVGIEFDELDNYFSRVIKDKKGLMKVLGTEEKSHIKNLINSAADKKPNGKLSELEENDIINKYLFGIYDSKTKKLSSVKERKVKAVYDDIRKFYADPAEAAHTYVRSALDEVNRRKMIGTKLSADYNDFDKSFGELAKQYTDDQQRVNEIKDLLMARFYYGTHSPAKSIQATRDVIYSSLLGNPHSALTQLKDLGMISYKYGVKTTASSMFGHKQLSAKQMGLIDTLSEEFVSKIGTKHLAKAAFKYSGFAKVDQFGKNTFINAALKSHQDLARTPKGRQKLIQKWAGVFGEDLPQIVDDLQRGKITPDIKAIVFAETADIHPLTMIAMPEYFAKHPNGRLFYTLQTYFAKHMNLIRRDILREFAKGSKKTAMKNAVMLASTYTALGMGVDSIREVLKGREVQPEDLAINSVLGSIGASRYGLERMGEGPMAHIGAAVLPPTKPFDDVLIPAYKATTGQDVTEKDIRNIVRYIPVFGTIVAEWGLGGAEDYNRRH